MILFSTMLDFNNTLTKDNLIELMIEWNQGSPHESGRIPEINWNGERNIRFEGNGNSLTIEEYRNKNTIAIRYEKIGDGGAVWHTDCIANFDEMKMALSLDRTFSEEALQHNKEFSVPFIITLLMSKGYLEDDNSIQLMQKPHYISADNIEFYSEFLTGKSVHRQPIIYVSQTEEKNYPFNLYALTRRVKGIAHVFAPENLDIQEKLKETCDGIAEEDGTVSIYLPNVGEALKTYHLAAFNNDAEAMLLKIAGDASSFTIAQQIPSLYTWDGVNIELLRDRLLHQKQKRRAAENEIEDALTIAEISEEEKRDISKQMDELSRTNEQLREENEMLKQALLETENRPALYFGKEREFFPGEIKEILLDALDAQLNSLANNKRRHDVVTDVLDNNNRQHTLKKRANALKAEFRGAYGRKSAQDKLLETYGFKKCREKNHYIYKYFDDDRYTLTLASTPSIYGHAPRNAVSKVLDLAF